MKKRIDKPVKAQTAITFISGSAGEIDWVLPILYFLLNKGFNLKIIFLTRHARKSVEKNRMLNDFICQENSKVEVILCGGYFFEKVERFGYLSYRLFLKLKLSKKPIFNKIYNLYDKVLERLFMGRLPSDIVHFEKEKYLFISEFPSLRRPRDNWIKKKFNRSIFFYCPHSPHIYAQELDRKYPEPDFIDFNKKCFLFLGHPGDYFIVNDGRELAAPNLEKVFTGHPKYSDSWLHNLQKTSKSFRSSSSTRETINVLVLSRGFGSYLDEESHNNLVETTIKVIHKQIPNYSLLVKKHPREISSHWDNILDDYSSVKIVDEHILQLATRVDFVITFWGSGAMDCFSLGVPVIEYWDPNKHSKDQVAVGDAYTTIYRKVGVVLSANTEAELERTMSDLVTRNYRMPSDELHPFFSDLINRSNQWDKTIEKILLSHNLMNN
jgi:hypothetical protein